MKKIILALALFLSYSGYVSAIPSSNFEPCINGDTTNCITVNFITGVVTPVSSFNFVSTNANYQSFNGVKSLGFGPIYGSGVTIYSLSNGIFPVLQNQTEQAGYASFFPAGTLYSSGSIYPVFNSTGLFDNNTVKDGTLVQSGALSYENGKIRIGNKYLCIYMNFSQISNPQYNWTGGALSEVVGQNEECRTISGYENIGFGTTNPPPGPPPFKPAQEVISGLVCDTYSLPSIDEVSWYGDFGSLANRDVFRENGSLVQTGTGASTKNLDVMAIVGASSGATLPLGSLSFTGSTYADITDLGPDGQPPAIYSWLKRDGSIAGWNVVQIRGVNTSGFFGKYGIFEGKSTDGFTNQKIMYSTGGVAEANLFNNKVGTTWQVFSPVSGFSGVRVGYAPYTKRKACKLEGINSCEWKIEGGKNICGPVISQNFEVGICSVAGSGSIYGSGSCVPVVDSAGQVVDAGILPGEGTLVTLPDGSTKIVRVSPQTVSILFACPKSKDEPWYKYLFSCAGEVVGNIFDKVTGTTNTLNNSFVGTYSNERLYTGSFTGIVQNFGSGNNPLVGSGARMSTGALVMAIKGKLDTVGQPGPEIWQKMFTGGVALGLLIMILSILGMILGALRDREDKINKK